MRLLNKINLSYSSLQYAINICREKKRYRVGIAVENEIFCQYAKSFLLSLIGNNHNDIEQVIHTKYEFKIYFKNGSLINFITTNGNVRGQRAHLLIIDEAIPQETLECIVLPCLTTYYEEGKER